MASIITQQPPTSLCASSTASPHTASSDILYQSLPNPDSIRLLEIQPGPNSSRLSCRLFLSQLGPTTTTTPPTPPRLHYEAISYVWGSSAARTTVHCNGRDVSVTSSLADALMRFRPAAGAAPRVVWIDAVCINQADDREKGHQVKLMRLIYKRARRVLVWLGNAAHREQPRGAFSAICALANQTVPLDAPPSARATWAFDTESDRTVAAAAAPEDLVSSSLSRDGSQGRNILVDRWEALAPFYALPWFRRVWVIQEIALSAVATMHWGSGRDCAYISWAHVARATDRIIELKNRLPLHRLPGVLHAHLMGSLWQTEQRSKRRVNSGGDDSVEERMPFEELFVRTSKFEVTDPRDRVYGLLGIPTREANPDEGELYLEPDYGVNLVGLYVRLFQKQGLRLRDPGNLS